MRFDPLASAGGPWEASFCRYLRHFRSPWSVPGSDTNVDFDAIYVTSAVLGQPLENAQTLCLTLYTSLLLYFDMPRKVSETIF